MDAVTNVPVPVNEPVRAYAPGSQDRTALEAKIKEIAGDAGRPDDDHRRRAALRLRRARSTWSSRTTTRHVLGRITEAGDDDVRAAVDAARAAAPGWRGAVLRRPGRDLPARRRPAGRPVARDDERRDDPRPVQVGAAGRDRRRLRADRLPAVQRLLRARADDPAADLLAGRVEPDGVPAPGGLRRRDHAVQLHRDRGQPAGLGRAHGQRGRVEAVPDAVAVGALHDAAARRGRPPAGRDQPGHRLRRSRSPTSPCASPTSPASTSPAPPRPSSTCGARSGRTSPNYRTYPRLVGETGGKDFVVAHPSADPAALTTHPGPRRVRVPGAEVLRGLPRVRPALAVERHARRPHRHRRVPDDGQRRRGPVGVHGRGHRRPCVRQAPRRAGAREVRSTGSRSTSAAASTTPRATSCSRPCWRARTRPTRSSPRSTSARSSACTSTTTRTTTPCSPRWRAPRRTP